MQIQMRRIFCFMAIMTYSQRTHLIYGITIRLNQPSNRPRKVGLFGAAGAGASGPSRTTGSAEIRSANDRRSSQEAVVAFVTAGRPVQHTSVVPHDRHVRFPAVPVDDIVVDLVLVNFAQQ